MSTKNLITLIFIFVFVLGYCQSPAEDAPQTDYNNIENSQTPNAAGFTQYGNHSVNTATGTPNISIPIYTLEVDGVRVPIYLSYNASGVKVNELATAVGLKWTLNAGGGIFRTVKNKPDDIEGWLDPFYTSLPDSHYANFNPNNTAWQKDMTGDAGNDYNGFAKTRDHNPDDFSYSFLGYSGNFILKKNGAVLKEIKDQLEINFMGTKYITDAHGNTYGFDYTETSEDRHVIHNGSDLDVIEFDDETETSWLLSHISTKNGKNITFQYEPYDIDYTLQNISQNLSLSFTCNQQTPSEINGVKSYTNTTYDYTNQLIKKIITENVEVIFNYTDDLTLSHWKRKLTSIVIKDKITNTQKSFEFTYGKFNGDPRLKLTEVREKGTDANTLLPPYKFFYNETYAMPQKNSYAQDFFGYYNHKTSNTSLVHRGPELNGYFFNHQGFLNQNNGNRGLDANAVKNGVLQKIVYPTGGSTEFTFAANSLPDPYSTTDKYCGGLRIMIIEDKDADNTTASRKVYTYEGLNGFNMESNVDLTRKKKGNEPDIKYIYYSSFVAPQGPDPGAYRTGYFYDKVTIRTYDGLVNYKEEHLYEEDIHSHTKLLFNIKEQRYYKGNDLLKVVDYEYNNHNEDQETLTWNILSDMICFGSFGFERFGYGVGKQVTYIGNRVKLPSRIATTEYLGTTPTSSLHPFTTVKTIEYNADLNTVESITDSRLKRATQNGDIVYILNDANGEVLKTTYTYAPDHPETQSLPKSLVTSKIVHSENFNDVVDGSYFEYDTSGNIKKTYGYNKGAGSNTSPLNYIPPNYDLVRSFVFVDGKPVQVIPENGIPVSYIYGYNDQLPVAKVENKAYGLIPAGLISSIKTASNTNDTNGLVTALNNLRNSTSLSGAMVSTYTHHPLFGMTSMTDPKGDTVTYGYDVFGRVKEIKDAQGNLLEEYKHNYKQ